MCLSPLKLFNPTKRISKYGGQSFVLEVPCGQCAECKQQMRTAWYFRTYYHCKELYDNNGYAFFCTLTYDNEHLPHAKDFCDKLSSDLNFPCFNPDHYRTFFKELRTYLRRNGYGNVKLTYFFTTEYGMNPSDGVTYRPHYHVIIFIDDSNSEKKLDVFTLSSLIDHYWIYGRTDGVSYKSRKYVQNHAFGKRYCRDFIHMRSVCNYVSKYITKDSDFKKIIEDRLQSVYNYLSEDRISYHRRLKIKDQYKEIKRCMDQFHRQSHHFGEYYLSSLSASDFNQVMKTSMMSMPDKHDIIKHAPLCDYYKRKLFYEKVKDENGNDYWRLSEFGKIWKMERMLKSIDLLSQRYDDMYMNLPFRMTNRQEAFDKMDQISTLLDGRNFRDFAIYLLLYRGKTRYGLQCSQPGSPSCLHPAEADLGCWVQYLFSDVHEVDDDMLMYHYASISDRKLTFGSTFITDKYLGDKDAGYSEHFGGIECGYDDLTDKYLGNFIDTIKQHKYCKRFGDVISDDEFVLYYTINENTDFRFRNFDKIYRIFNECMSDYNEGKEELFNHIERLNKVHKSLSQVVE